MSSEEMEMMKKFSLRFREVGWLNDEVRFLSIFSSLRVYEKEKCFGG